MYYNTPGEVMFYTIFQISLCRSFLVARECFQQQQPHRLGHNKVSLGCFEVNPVTVK